MAAVFRCWPFDEEALSESYLAKSELFESAVISNLGASIRVCDVCKYVYACCVLSSDDIELRSDAPAVIFQLWLSRAHDVRYLTAELNTCTHHNMLPCHPKRGNIHMGYVNHANVLISCSRDYQRAS